MSYNGSGTFNINTSGQPVVTGTVISSTAFNALTADLGTGLSTAITKNGQTTVTANIPFNGFKLTGIGVATASGDALTYGQAATVTTLVASTSITDSGLTSGRVTYAGTAGLLQDSANLTFNGTTLTANTIGAFTLGGTVAGGGNQLNNVIIGTTTPLAGAFTTLSATGTITSTNSGLLFNRTGGTTTQQYLRFANTDGDLYLGVSNNTGTAFATGETAYAVVLMSAGAKPLQLASNGIVTLTSNAAGTGIAVTGTLSATTTGQVGTTLGVGAATPSASGAGITFPATQSASSDANTLDDYEEGTWTPELLSTGASFTYPRGQYGSYVKIGSLVYAQFYIGADTTGTTTNQCNLAGLPFSSGNLSALAQASACAWVSNTTPLGFTQNNNSNQATIWIQNIGGTTTANALQVAGGYLVGTIIYRSA